MLWMHIKSCTWQEHAVCVKRAHNRACTCKCLVLLTHSDLLLPFRAFDQVAWAWCTFGFGSVGRASNKKMICYRGSQCTFTKCTSQPWNACLIIEILSPVDVGVLLLTCKHLHVPCDWWASGMGGALVFFILILALLIDSGQPHGVSQATPALFF